MSRLGKIIWTGAATIGIILSAPSGASRHTALRMSGEWAVIQVRLGEDPRPYLFIVDTAAGATVVDATVARHFVVPKKGAGSTVQGASGANEQFDAGSLGRLWFAGVDVTGLDVVVTDMARFGEKTHLHYNGILGNDVLRRTAYIFDVPAGRLTLLRGATPDAHRWSTCAANPFAGRTDGTGGFVGAGALFAPRRTATAILDTGAASTILNWPAARAAGFSPGGVGTTGGKDVVGFDPKAATTSSEATIIGASLGGAKLPAFKARLSDLVVFKSFGLAEAPAMIVGINILRDVPFAVSQGGAMICTKPIDIASGSGKKQEGGV